MATIDKGSITATKSNDDSVFQIGFDFTDSTSLNVNQGWLVPWLHAQFTYNTNMTDTEFNQAAVKAMTTARKPGAETVLETSLRNKFGTTVIRTDPNPVTTYQKMEIVSVSTSALFYTKVTS